MRPSGVHPRVCGEARIARSTGGHVTGPSPRVRGSPPTRRRGHPDAGSIPACAGKPTGAGTMTARARVHPRVCGEAAYQLGERGLAGGPSPRVRGSPDPGRDQSVHPGSIPACAGKPRGSSRRSGPSRVHPRVCGEAPAAARHSQRRRGPSPRVRGSRIPEPAAEDEVGSIPACAGKPRPPAGPARRSWVHPRVCGEAPIQAAINLYIRGPSPRVRGSPGPDTWTSCCGRSIPACAGKPDRSARRARACRVHPRVCGEARSETAHDALGAGPSPRVRGSRSGWPVGTPPSGSIPACAGKPRAGDGGEREVRVHPRVCGEASSSLVLLVRVQGPSPRVRGSPSPSLHPFLRSGSIPACAGKPRGSRGSRHEAGVHPRVCGEAKLALPWRRAQTGPSPRVRGSLPDELLDRGGGGSIPACAGKPPEAVELHGADGVHPRVCGEAWTAGSMTFARAGPSPRVRGSQRGSMHPSPSLGSIPACAGKPARSRRPGCGSWVHPRVCGEASLDDVGLRAAMGPSPRVRGSLRPGARDRLADGSIPACAGKPSSRMARSVRSWVHPRVCGEACRARIILHHDHGPSPRVRGSQGAGDGRRRRDGSIPACAGKPSSLTLPGPPPWVHPRVCGEAAPASVFCRVRKGPSPRVRGSRRRRSSPGSYLRSIPACAGKPRWRR